MKYFKFFLLVCLCTALLRTLIEFDYDLGIGIIPILLISSFIIWLIYILYNSTIKDFNQDILLYLILSVMTLNFLTNLRNFDFVKTTDSNVDHPKEISMEPTPTTIPNQSPSLEKDLAQVDRNPDMTLMEPDSLMGTDTFSNSNDYDYFFEQMVGIPGSSKVVEISLQENTVIKGYKYYMDRINIFKVEWIETIQQNRPPYYLKSISFTNNLGNRAIASNIKLA